jgi:hypothetical protein
VRLPMTVVIVAILFIAGGLISLLLGVVRVGTGGIGLLTGLVTFSDSVRTWGGSTLWHGTLECVSGVVQIATGFGLLQRGAKWSSWVYS